MDQPGFLFTITRFGHVGIEQSLHIHHGLTNTVTEAFRVLDLDVCQSDHVLTVGDLPCPLTICSTKCEKRSDPQWSRCN